MMELNIEKTRDFWEENHKPGSMRFLSNSNPELTYRQHGVSDVMSGPSKTIMEIGVGVATSIRFLAIRHNVVAVDISSRAIEKVKDIAQGYLTEDMPKIKDKSVDVAISHIVLQHCEDQVVDFIIGQTLRTLKDDGFFSFQIACCNDINETLKKRLTQEEVVIEWIDRPVKWFEEIVAKNNGKVVRRPDPIYGMGRTKNIDWYFLHVM